MLSSATSSPPSRPSLSPSIHTLPNEILTSIFLLSKDATTIALSQVCRRWREVAMGYPVLWARMLDFDLDSLEWGEELLRRSQDLPIDIGHKFAPSYPLHLGRALAQSHRWRTFSIELTGTDDALIPTLSRPAPHLEVFCLHVHRTIELKLPASLFAADAPNLREIRLSRCGFNPSNTSIFGNLTTISVLGTNGGGTALRPNVAQWLQVLNAAPLLETLQLEQAIAPSAGAETLLQVDLLNLSCIHLSGSTTVCGQLLGQINAPFLSQLMVWCSFNQHNDNFKTILVFVEARFGWGRPDFDNVGCRTILGLSFFKMTYEPQECDPTTPYLIMNFDWGSVTDTDILQNIMHLFVNPLLTALHSLMLQTTCLTLVDPNNTPSPGVLPSLHRVTSVISILATFRKVHTLKMSGELQRIVFVLLSNLTDANVDCLLPALRKLELDMINVDIVSTNQRATPLFDILIDVVQNRIEKGVGIEVVEFDDDSLSNTQQVDMLKALGVQVVCK